MPGVDGVSSPKPAEASRVEGEGLSKSRKSAEKQTNSEGNPISSTRASLRASQRSSFISAESTRNPAPVVQKSLDLKPEKTTITVLIVNPPKVIYSKVFKENNGGLNSYPESGTSSANNEILSFSVSSAAVAASASLEEGEVREAAAESGKSLGKSSSLLSSLSVLLNKSGSFIGEGLISLVRPSLPNNLQFQTSSQKGSSTSDLLQNHSVLRTSSELGAGAVHLSSFRPFAEAMVHHASLALSIGLSNAIQLNPAQAFSLALAYSLNLSPEETSKLLSQLQAAGAEHLSSLAAPMNEQARLANPFIQGMVLTDPSSMKGFLAQLFSPALKSLMGLLFTKELHFNYFPSNLLTELGSLMARSAQRKRNRYSKKRIGKADRVSRKDPLFVEIDFEDENDDFEDEMDWWGQFYPSKEATTFLWS